MMGGGKDFLGGSKILTLLHFGYEILPSMFLGSGIFGRCLKRLFTVNSDLVGIFGCKKVLVFGGSCFGLLEFLGVCMVS